MDEREVSPIASCVEGRCSFGQMLADDSGITDLLVTERKLIMRKANGARIVRQLRMLQRTRMEGDGARLLAAVMMIEASAGERSGLRSPIVGFSAARREAHRSPAASGRNRAFGRRGRAPRRGCKA